MSDSSQPNTPQTPNYLISQVGTCPVCGFNRHINKYGVLTTCGHDPVAIPSLDRIRAIRAIETARRMGYSGVWLSVEEAESLIK